MEDIATLDEPLPLVRGDSWDWFVVLWADTDRANPYDMTGKTAHADIRWIGGSQAVTCAVTNAAAGLITFSIAKEDTTEIPLGALSTLVFDIIDGDTKQTWFRAPIEAKEGFTEL